MQTDKGTTAAQEATRASLATYLDNVEGALTAASRSELTQGVVAPYLEENLNALAAAKRQLPLLTAEDLNTLEDAAAGNPAWEQQPAAIERALSQLPAAPAKLSASPESARAAAAAKAAGLYTACGSFGDTRALFYSSWAANQAALALAFANDLLDFFDAAIPKAITAVAWGAVQVVYIGLNDGLTRAVDCENALSNALFRSAWPDTQADAKDSRFTGHTSSQASVDQLAATVAGTATALDAMSADIDDTNAVLFDTINKLGAGQGTAVAIQSTAGDLQPRSKSLSDSIGDPTDPVAPDATTANGLANTINARADTTLAKTGALRTLAVRLEIEHDLASEPKLGIAMFTLPASKGGYIETVRDVVTRTLANELAARQAIGAAMDKLAAANASLAAKQYEDAYSKYVDAYREAVK